MFLVLTHFSSSIMEYGCTERVTDHSCVGAKLEETTRVIWKLKLHITCYEDEVIMQPVPVFYGTIVPLVAWFTISP